MNAVNTTPGHAEGRPAPQAAKLAGATSGARAGTRPDAGGGDAFAELLQALGEGLGDVARALDGAQEGAQDGDPADGREQGTSDSAQPRAGAEPALPTVNLAAAPTRHDAAPAFGLALQGELRGTASEGALRAGDPGPGAAGGRGDAAGRGRFDAQAAARAQPPQGPRSMPDLPGAAALLPQAADGAAQAPFQAALAAAGERAAPQAQSIGPAAPDASVFALHEARAPVNAPPAGLQAELASRPGEASFPGELAAQVQVMVEGGIETAQLRLNPAELGPIRITLDIQGQTAEIRFEAAHDATREGISQGLDELREMLAGEGLSLGQAQVGAGSEGTPWGQQRQAEARPGAAQAAAHARVAGQDMPEHAPAAPRALRGMLDLYA